MNKNKIFNKKNICYLVSFFLPIFLFILICIMMEFYPFGNISILVADMRYQFVDYYAYLKQSIANNNDMLYSFSKTFGGDMTGFFAYYLGNPLYFIFMFFSEENLPMAILFMLALSMGLCGYSFCYFLNNTFGFRKSSVIFSTAYAFMGYLTAYMSMTHITFNMALLPFVMLGIVRIVRTRKTSKMYIFTLFLSVLIQYYVGYMACIFTFFFLCYELVKEKMIFSKKPFFDIRKLLDVLVVYIGNSFLAVGLSAVSLVSVLFSLRDQKSSGLILSFSRNFYLMDLPSSFYNSAFHGNLSDGLPIVYCSVVALVFLSVFYLSKKIALRNKIASLVVLLILFISCYIDFFNTIWHGFAHPIGFPHRFSFLISFFLLYIAYEGYLHLQDGFELYKIIICIGLFSIYSVYLYMTNSEYAGKKEIIITGTIILVIYAFIYGYSHYKEYQVSLLWGILFVMCLDVSTNAFYSYDAYYEGQRLTNEEFTIGEYQKYIKETGSLIRDIQKSTTGFYRIEKFFRRSHNDAMQFGYNGLSHFSSCENNTVKRFLGHMGFRDNGNWAFYGSGSTAFADSFMGVKFVLSQIDEISKPYIQTPVEYNKYIYQNPYALSLAFGMTEDVEKIKFQKDAHFDFQNEIAGSFSKQKHQIYKPVKLERITLNNVTRDGDTYNKKNPEEEAYIEYELSCNSTDFIFMYLDAPKEQKTSLYINDLEKPDYFTTYGWQIREVGYYNKGDDVHVRLYLIDDQITINGYEFYYEDKKELADWYEDAKRSVCELNKITSSHLLADVSMADDHKKLVFSIPYEKDWIVFVDQKRVKTEPVLNALLSIDITKGKHVVEMYYIPRGLVIGFIISITSFMILIAFLIYNYNNERKRKIRKETVKHNTTIS